jgi:hypothetical protein
LTKTLDSCGILLGFLTSRLADFKLGRQCIDAFFGTVECL